MAGNPEPRAGPVHLLRRSRSCCTLAGSVLFSAAVLSLPKQEQSPFCSPRAACVSLTRVSSLHFLQGSSVPFLGTFKEGEKPKPFEQEEKGERK